MLCPPRISVALPCPLDPLEFVKVVEVLQVTYAFDLPSQVVVFDMELDEV